MSQPNDFDENTPRPRTRPQGDPLPRRVKVPPGESVIGLFAAWDNQGRVPEGSVLADFVGRQGDNKSGYTVAALDAMGRIPLGAVGKAIKSELLEGYVIHCEILQERRVSVVFAPQTQKKEAKS